MLIATGRLRMQDMKMWYELRAISSVGLRMAVPNTTSIIIIIII